MQSEARGRETSNLPLRATRRLARKIAVNRGQNKPDLRATELRARTSAFGLRPRLTRLRPPASTEKREFPRAKRGVVPFRYVDVRKYSGQLCYR